MCARVVGEFTAAVKDELWGGVFGVDPLEGVAVFCRIGVAVWSAAHLSGHGDQGRVPGGWHAGPCDTAHAGRLTRA